MNVAVVCCYFNFTNSAFRYKNYQHFQKNIRKHNIKLLTVEFNPTNRYELNNKDADSLVQTSDGDIMWQKERLLNIGIDLLPSNTDIVIIADTDIVFGREDFVDILCKSLEQYKVVQCFSDTLVFNPLLELDDVNFFKLNHNLTYNFCNMGTSVVRNHLINGAINRSDSAYGLAWAFRYDILKSIKLFDYNIIGSGDKLLFGALFDILFKHEVAGINIKPYVEYTKNLSLYVKPEEVSFVNDLTVYSMYHGELVNRRYVERHDILTNHLFDCSKDLIDIENKPFRFSDHVTVDLKNNILRYFLNRKDALPLPPCLY